MENVLMEAHGSNGRLELLEDRVRIKRKGLGALIAHGWAGDKDIPILKISSIQFRNASLLGAGYIHFAFEGGVELQGGLTAAGKSESAVTFGRRQQKAFDAIKAEVEKRMVAIASRTPPRAHSDLDELEKLADLRDKGIITEDEFDAKKKQLLGL